MKIKYSLDDIKYKECKERSYIKIEGWCFNEEAGELEYQVIINNETCPFSLKRFIRKDVLQYYGETIENKKIGFQIFVDLKQTTPNQVQVFACAKDDRQRIFNVGHDKLNKIKDIYPFEYNIDSLISEQNEQNVSGWAFSLSGTPLEFRIRSTKNHNLIDQVCQWSFRNDVADIYDLPESQRCCGFQLQFKADETFKIFIECDGAEYEISQNKQYKSVRNLFSSYARNVNKENLKKAVRYFRQNGFFKFAHRLALGPSTEITYEQWFINHQPTRDELNEQRNIKFTYSPKISLIVAAYNTPIPFLKEMISSVLDQTYANWELCIADGSTNNGVQNYMESNHLTDARIKYEKLSDNFGISENMNAALHMATGDYIGFYDHDDLLTPNALYEVVSSLQKKKYPFIYSDEDKYMTDLKVVKDPHFKSDFNIDLLRSVNYICHFLVVSRELIEKVGSFRKEYDGAQDYDFILRCIEVLKEEEIYHIPKILYHWRMHSSSTASNPQSKLYAFEAGKRAIQSHLDRLHLSGTVTMQENLGLYRVKYDILRADKISILIPNKDHIDDLEKCIQSVFKSHYKNFEIIIIENNSTEHTTFDYYHTLENEYDCIKVVYWKDEFNYSAINNFGAQHASGEYLLLLNNDTEMMDEFCLEELLSFCQRKEVGIVGSRLVYDDDTIQHAGVIVGLGGIAGHSFVGEPMNAPGYFGRILCAQDLSAVTAACLMVKKEIFKMVQGLSEDLKVAFNDIDFCLKVREKGYLIVYNPYALLYHYESKSRGAEDSPEKVQRFNNEIHTFRNRWPEILKKGDPYYNPNLAYMGQSYTLKDN